MNKRSFSSINNCFICEPWWFKSNV